MTNKITEQELEETFKKIDSNISGFVTVSELRGFIENMGGYIADADMIDYLEKHDKNKEDGTLDLAEFKKMLSGISVGKDEEKIKEAIKKFVS